MNKIDETRKDFLSGRKLSKIIELYYKALLDDLDSKSTMYIYYKSKLLGLDGPIYDVLSDIDDNLCCSIGNLKDIDFSYDGGSEVRSIILTLNNFKVKLPISILKSSYPMKFHTHLIKLIYEFLETKVLANKKEIKYLVHKSNDELIKLLEYDKLCGNYDSVIIYLSSIHDPEIIKKLHGNYGVKTHIYDIDCSYLSSEFVDNLHSKIIEDISSPKSPNIYDI